MPLYSCKVRDHRGEAFIKTMSGDTAAEVRNRLRELGYMVVSPVTEKKENRLAALGAAGNQLQILARLNTFMEGRAKIQVKEISIFSRQFATMINSGVAMVRALDILTDQTQSVPLRRVIEDLKTRVESGSALSDAMAKHPIFDQLYVGMVRAGEAGGVLDEVLGRLAMFQERSTKLQGQVKSAMTYPIAVGVMALAVFIVMLVFVLPVFANMFSQMNAALPAYTQFLINLSTLARGPVGLGVVVGIAGVVWVFRRWAATPHGRQTLDHYALELPMIGPVVQKVAVARFTRTLGTLLRSGVPLLNSLEIVRDSAGNVVVARAVEDIAEAVKEGEGISGPLEKADIFPPMVTQMISVGEETGNVDAMLEKVADFYDEEVEAAVKSLTSMLEPLMMAGIGGLVGSIVVGMYLPIFSIINTMK